jgi:hypothetical protein
MGNVKFMAKRKKARVEKKAEVLIFLLTIKNSLSKNFKNKS